MKARGLRWCLGGGLLALVLPGLALAADASCRMAFDMGSSGIRAGTSLNAVTPRAEIDFLKPLWAGQGLEASLPATVDALKSLPLEGGFPPDCPGVGGGFSAWRLALEQDPAGLVRMLRAVYDRTSVAVLVIPPATEGLYGFVGARLALGGRLNTSHVLDIGGGSFQIAGAAGGVGAPLGQKAWRRWLCGELHGVSGEDCVLAPLDPRGLARARALARVRLAELVRALPRPMTLTAISRPVSREVAPAVRRFAGSGDDPDALSLTAITTAIDRLAPLAAEATDALVGLQQQYGQYLLSDMLLVEAVLDVTAGRSIRVAELDLTNIPGLLADDQAYAWKAHYICYLERLARMGLSAYDSEPGTCGDVSSHLQRSLSGRDGSAASPVR